MKKFKFNIFLLLLLSIVNMLLMHYAIFFTCQVERQIDFTVYVDNLAIVVIEVFSFFILISIFTRGRQRLAALICSISTLLWSISNIVYSRFFYQYISLSSIAESNNLLDPFVLACLKDGFRWFDLYFLFSVILSVLLYKNSIIIKKRIIIRRGVFLILSLLFVDFVMHVAFCMYSPSMRYLSYIKHRISVEFLSPQCYTAQPIYSNFQRGTVRSFAFAIVENFSGKINLSEVQKKLIKNEQESLKPYQGYFQTNKKITNVIFILVESYMSFTVDMKINNKEVTPFLNSLKRDSDVYYNGNMSANITLGESSDGQFIYMTGLLPLKSAITVTKAKKNYYPALPRLFKKYKGMDTRMVIPTAPSMWSQNVMCERYGIESLYSTDNYYNRQYTYLSDDQIFKMASEVDRKSKRPFFSMILTFSMHQPYVKLIDSTFKENQKEYSTSLNNYLNACHFTDKQLSSYFKFLKDSRLFDESLIIIASDHHVSETALELPPSINNRKLPLFIINGGIDNEKSWKGDCNQLDLYTTLLDILDIQPAWCGFGHSLLSTNYKKSVNKNKWQYSEWIIKSDFFHDKKN